MLLFSFVVKNYHQYDNMALPNKGHVYKQWHISSPRLLTPLEVNHEMLQCDALKAYIQYFEDKLYEAKLSRDFNIEDATTQMMSIFNTLNSGVVSLSDKDHKLIKQKIVGCPNLPQV